MVLISVGVPNNQVTELTGLCDKSVRTLKKALKSGEVDNLFHIGKGGRKGKLIEVEKAIFEEISKNDYHSQQQIADMINEKFGIKVSADSVARLLKKRH
jgi:transposase